MKAGLAQCPACFFVFSPERFSAPCALKRFPRTSWSNLPRVRKTGLSTHDRGTRPDMGPRSRGALLLVDVDPVEGLEPGEPASPYTWGVAVGVAQELLDAVADLA